MQAARQSGIPELEGQIRSANKAWARAEAMFNQGVAKRLLEVSPEKVAEGLTALPTADLAMMKATVSPATWAALRGQAVRQMLSKAIEGELTPTAAGATFVPGLTKAMGPQTSLTRMRGNTFRTQLEKLGVRGRIIFGSDEMAELVALANEAERVGRKSSGYVPGLIAGGMNAWMTVGAPMAAWATGDLTPLLTAGTGAVALNVLSRLITKPQGLTKLRKFMRAVGSGDTVQANLWGTQISNALSEPERPMAVPKEQEQR